IPHMMRHRGGALVNIGSVAASHVFRGQAVYAATKGALESLTRALAVEYGRMAIRVNCVVPGPTETDMMTESVERAGALIKDRIPLRRLAKPEDIAAMVVFLLSDRAAYISGEKFTVDGGYTRT
ncbi:MAG: SDR family oxidoreductase, partial [Deltaproteobacteria bacterium]|nr:SDR family oxidoreductase [Deltaproteobacteria bacterium]